VIKDLRDQTYKEKRITLDLSFRSFNPLSLDLAVVRQHIMVRAHYRGSCSLHGSWEAKRKITGCGGAYL
jgi:hypothetical protein